MNNPKILPNKILVKGLLVIAQVPEAQPTKK
jgi:hypothetical protein